MKFIEFDESKCDNCLKCLRICPTKAISFNDSKRAIIDELCIKCGLCQAHCPQNALSIKNQIEEIIMKINDGIKTAVSIAPSFVGAFDMQDIGQMVGALKLLGFDVVEETAIGAEIVSSNYEKEISNNSYKNIITSCCPSANYLVEQHYSELIPYMMPFVSPMVAHGRYLKQRYGEETFTVFIGPCLAKMAEAEEMKGAIDAVITFEELYQWFSREKINLKEIEAISFDLCGTMRGKSYPMGGSLMSNNLRDVINSNYRYLHVNGIENCKDLFEELKTRDLENYCIEVNICNGGCMNGPEMPNNGRKRYEREKYMLNHIKQLDCNNPFYYRENEIEVKRTFENRQVNHKDPDRNVIKEILKKMGKYTEQDHLNCCACGYQSCEEKAKAVYYGYSDSNNCLPYLREKAVSMQSVMIENSPNAVCIIDSNLTIVENNPSFDSIFNDMAIRLTGMPIYAFMEDTLFEKALKEKKSIKGKKIYLDDINKHFIINIIYLEKENRLLAFFTDISKLEKKKEELEKVKEETLQKTQEVINKQMRVAQEIASLLGETTAETKMSLNSLKNLVLSDEGGI